MTEEPGESLSVLRSELLHAAQRTNLAERMLEVAAVVEAVAAPLHIHPVVVGGVAVYFWTASDEFLTRDIDVVMEVPEQLADRLAQLGFVRTKDGRHWTLEGTDVFLEAPSARLDRGAVVAAVKLPSGRTASVLSRVDVLLDRLDELQATGHLVVGQQVLALLGGMPDEETADLDARAEQRRVTKILAAMCSLADDITGGRREPPDTAEMHEIARAALRAEYSPRDP
ncbi:MAG TPA: hypothetical protein VFU94_07435 [Conexibacter sp.]|nr:hypothetical protein [Conexibacter sp.]